MKKLLIVTPIFLGLILSGCTIEKRHFRPGYHIEWKTKTWQPDPADFDCAPKQEEHAVPISIPVEAHSSATNHHIGDNIAATEEKPVEEKYSLPQVFQNPERLIDDTCDVLIKMNGDEVSARVTRINPTTIEYKRCDIPDGPLFVEKKSAFFMIKFRNGTKEVFQKNDKEVNDEQKTLGAAAPFSVLFAVASIALAVIGSSLCIVTFLMGLILGIIGLVQYHHAPQKYYPGTKVMSILSIAICGLIVAVFLGVLVMDML